MSTPTYEKEEKKGSTQIESLPYLLQTLAKLQNSKLISLEECEFAVASEAERAMIQSCIPPEVSDRIKFRLTE
jgi:hypothetical protein